jgi:IclR family transcriptional regulator, acetate operon repressor
MAFKVMRAPTEPRSGAGSDVRAVQRTISLLEALSSSGAGAPLASLAVAADLSQATTLRYLATLVRSGVVEKNAADGTYRLGLGFLLLWERAVGDLDPRQVAGPYMEALRDAYGETVVLAAFWRKRLVLIDAREGLNKIKMGARIGEHVPLHSNGVGKAILAHLDAAQRAALLEGHELAPVTANTIVDPALLERDLDRVRRRGYAIDDEESTVGLRCVAVPIFDRRGHPAFALSVSAPTSNVPLEALREIGASMVALTETVSRRFGYSGSIGSVA